jgi:hypothetical protein
MTREEFAQFIFDGPQWTPATRAAAHMAQEGMIPTCDVKTFEREVVSPSGVVPFQRGEPLFRFSV